MKTANRLKRSFGACVVMAAIALPAALGVSAAAQDYPDQSKRLDWTIAFGPGGGNDIMARTMIDILKKHNLYPGEIVAENRAGGSGAVGWGYLFSKTGDAYNISTTSGSFITTPLQADTPWKPTDFTPVALLATDDLLLLVKGDSEIKTLPEFIEAAKKDAPAIGGIGAVNVDFIVPKLLSEKAGFTFDYVSFNDAGELTTALLSSSLDAIMANPAEVLGLLDSGDMRALAYSGKQTPETLKDVPTLDAAGYPNDISQPRGLILPPGVPKEVQEWWIETMKKVVDTPEWKEYITKNNLTPNVLYGEEFAAFLSNTQDTFAKVLREAGAIK